MKIFRVPLDYILEWYQYRVSLSQLLELTDRDLRDVGISRCDIYKIARDHSARRRS
jgi:uncharacterized protein YjiS (DUF1127 family)